MNPQDSPEFERIVVYQELAKILDPVRLAWETNRSYQQARSECGMRSPQSEAHQSDLLTLLEKSQESALRLEVVPINLTVGNSERFWLIHQESQLRIPGQFSHQEAEHILKATEGWNWEIDYRLRTPRCSYQLFSLLSSVCTPQVQEVAA